MIQEYADRIRRSAEEVQRMDADGLVGFRVPFVLQLADMLDGIPWQPIDKAPFKPDAPFGQPRIMLWIPPTATQIGRAVFGCYDADTYAKKPRPFWSYEGVRTTDARARQPTHFITEPTGPT